jgi:hypothetical protein
MSIPTRLAQSVGQWAGPSLLSFGPDHPTMSSDSTAIVAAVVNGTGRELRYAWSFEGKPQHGVMLIADDSGSGRCDIAWKDSFQCANRIVLLTGAHAGDGEANVHGSYPAPEGPDGGWRMTHEMPTPESLLLRMFNITPDGQEAWAVEASCRRH